MNSHPEIVLHRRNPQAKVSVILIDWGVRESFHSLHYLNQQTVKRSDYELIWLEFYDRKPHGLRDAAACVTAGRPALDKWLVLGYPDNYLYHKHRLYNIGILAAEGEICVICDSDAIFQPTFIEKLINGFAETPNAVIHLDEVRNRNSAFYPFNYPSIQDILGPGCLNWQNDTTLGLDNSSDMLHHANYGACMAAWRRDLLAIGGADEDIDYLGYVCGPYDLTFRLCNYGREERWLRDEYLYHTWHPNQYGWNTDYQGPHDGMHMAMLALESRVTKRLFPYQKNPWFPRTTWGRPLSIERLLDRVQQRAEPQWQAGTQPSQPIDRAYKMRMCHYGFDLFRHADGSSYGAPESRGGLLQPRANYGKRSNLWHASTEAELIDQLPIDYPLWKRLGENAWSPGWLWWKLRSQPLHRLPERWFAKRDDCLLPNT